MIDFHSHIIPGIDDGSKSVEETFNLIKEAKAVGFDGIISTSHYIEEYYEVGAKEREKWLEAIAGGLKEQGVDINLYIGSEIYITENIMKLLSEGKASTVNNTSYVLFEMSLNAKPLNLYDVIYEIQEHKLVPILAHPERYSFVQEEPELVYDLIEKGVLMQSNYCSILGVYGKKAEIIVRKLFENNMVHFLGSDVHRQDSIYPKVPQAMEEIKQIIGEEKLNELTTINPELVIQNKKIEAETPRTIHLSMKEKLIMKMTK